MVVCHFPKTGQNQSFICQWLWFENRHACVQGFGFQSSDSSASSDKTNAYKSVSPLGSLSFPSITSFSQGSWTGFLCSLVSKASACNTGDLGSIPGSGRSPGEGNGNPLQYSCLENPLDRGAWRATVLGITRVGDDLALSFFLLSFFLDGHGPSLASLKPALISGGGFMSDASASGPGVHAANTHPSQALEGIEGVHGRHILFNPFFRPSVCLSFFPGQ